MCQFRISSDWQLCQCKEAGMPAGETPSKWQLFWVKLTDLHNLPFTSVTTSNPIISGNESFEHFCHITSFTACLMYSMQDWAHIVAVQLCRSQLVTQHTSTSPFFLTDTTTAACCLYSQSVSCWDSWNTADYFRQARINTAQSRQSDTHQCQSATSPVHSPDIVVSS